MKIIGITGNIGSGKSTFSRELCSRGPCKWINADIEAHNLYERNHDLVQELAHRFGDKILFPNGSINRKILGNLVFSDPTLLKTLNEMVYPELKKHLVQLCLQDHHNIEFLLFDAPLLIEWDFYEYTHFTILVDAEPETRLKRLIERGLSENEANDRIRAQVPASEKMDRCDLVINNNSTLANLIEEVNKSWSIIRYLYLSLHFIIPRLENPA
jgi:dephospho-CoA kinase